MKKGYVGYVINSEVRMNSTSGGICQLISRFFIQNKGIVSGVAFDKDFNVKRILINNIMEIELINKSKYVQAFQADSYLKIHELLKKGEEVLFIGTPCEVSGLKSYIGKDYANLYCIDFVCLGVPSAKAWSKYLSEVKRGRNIEKIDYKDKRNGWKNFNFYMKFLNQEEMNESGRDNLYMKMMINKFSVRPSCYQCKFRTLDRVSDITVADAWGMERIAAELIDDKGTSSIMVNSKKGEKLINMIEKECKLKEVEVADLWKGNFSAFSQYKKPLGRYFFYKLLNWLGFEKTYRIFEFLCK